MQHIVRQRTDQRLLREQHEVARVGCPIKKHLFCRTTRQCLHTRQYHSIVVVIEQNKKKFKIIKQSYFDNKTNGNNNNKKGVLWSRQCIDSSTIMTQLCRAEFKHIRTRRFKPNHNNTHIYIKQQQY